MVIYNCFVLGYMNTMPSKISEYSFYFIVSEMYRFKKKQISLKSASSKSFHQGLHSIS